MMLEYHVHVMRCWNSRNVTGHKPMNESIESDAVEIQDLHSHTAF